MSYWQEQNDSVQHRLQEAPGVLWDMWRGGMTQRTHIQFAHFLSDIYASLAELSRHRRLAPLSRRLAVEACTDILDLHPGIDHSPWLPSIAGIQALVDPGGRHARLRVSMSILPHRPFDDSLIFQMDDDL